MCLSLYDHVAATFSMQVQVNGLLIANDNTKGFPYSIHLDQYVLPMSAIALYCRGSLIVWHMNTERDRACY